MFLYTTVSYRCNSSAFIASKSTPRGYYDNYDPFFLARERLNDGSAVAFIDGTWVARKTDGSAVAFIDGTGVAR